MGVKGTFTAGGHKDGRRGGGKMYSIVRMLQNQFSASLDSFLLQSDIGRKTVREKKNRGPGEEKEEEAAA